MNLFKMKYDNENAIKNLTNELVKIFEKHKDIIIVNIGTDRVTGDCIAPLIGTLLKENKFNIPVFGTLSDPIHAVNLKDKLNMINLKYPHATIISIDASLGDSKTLEEICLRDIPISPGKGVGKDLPQVGDYSIACVMDDYDKNISFLDRNIRLDFVLKMAKIVAKSLIQAENTYKKNNEYNDSDIAVCNL